jgi:hypothetical protein
MNRLYFREEQRYTQWWVWLLLSGSYVVSVLPLWYGVYVQASTGHPWGNKPLETDKLVVVAIIITLMMSAIVWLFAFQKLITEVSPDGVRYRYLPFIRKWKQIPKESIAGYTVGKYTPITTYGGWGIRSGGKKAGKAYTISGSIGLTLNLTDGKTILLGTERKDALKYAMEKMMGPQSP